MRNYKTPDMQTRLRLRRGLTVLDDLGEVVKLPKAVTDAKAKLDRLRERAHNAERDDDIRRRSVAALIENPDADISSDLFAETMTAVTKNTYTEAVVAMEYHVSHVVLAHADELLELVRSNVFDPALATITEVAMTTSPTDTAYSLLRAKNTKAATALADAPAAVVQVGEAFRLRRGLYARSGVDDLATSRFKNPNDLDRWALNGLEGVDYWVTAIRLGGEPWLGTYTEVDTTSRALHKPKPKPPAPAAARPVRKRKATPAAA